MVFVSFTVLPEPRPDTVPPTVSATLELLLALLATELDALEATLLLELLATELDELLELLFVVQVRFTTMLLVPTVPVKGSPDGVQV